MAAVAHFNGAREGRRSPPSRPRAILRGASLGLALLACLGLGPARPALVWVAPSECPQAPVVQAQLDQLLAESETELAVEAAAHVERVRGRRYRLELRLHVGAHHAQRALESDSCEELAQTAAWLIAVAVDPAVRGPAPPAATDPAAPAQVSPGSGTGAPAPSAEPASQAQPRESAAPARASSPEAGGESYGTGSLRARAWPGPRVARAAAHAGVSFGTAGAAQAELGGAGGIGFGWLYSELDFSVLLPRREELTAAAVVTSWSLQLGLRGCALWGARLRWGPCLTLDAVRTVGHAEGLSTLQPDQALFWALAGAALRAAWKLRDRLELTLGGGAGLPISPRPRFTVEGLGEVAPVSVVTGYLRIGVGFASR